MKARYYIDPETGTLISTTMESLRTKQKRFSQDLAKTDQAETVPGSRSEGPLPGGSYALSMSPILNRTPYS